MKKFTLKDVLTAACTWTPPEKRNEPIKQSKESPKKKQPIKKEATKDYSQLFIKDFMELARTRSKWTHHEFTRLSVPSGRYGAYVCSWSYWALGLPRPHARWCGYNVFIFER